MDALSVRWKSSREEKWRGAFKLSEQWKGKKVYMFVAMGKNVDSVEFELLR